MGSVAAVPTSEAIRAAVDAYVDASNRNDKSAVIAMFAPDCEWFDPVGQPPHAGREGVAEFWDQTREMAESIEMVPRGIVVCGNEAAMVFAIRATVAGTVMEMDAVETFAVDDDGLFTNVKAYWDMARGRVVEA